MRMTQAGWVDVEGVGALIHVRLFGLAATASSSHDFLTGNS